MALPNVFSPGQIFTAANANLLRSNQYNQTVTNKTVSYTPTTTTDIGTRVIMNSASATTITINTSIYSAGDTFFISNIGVGVCTLTAGTCTISSAGSLAVSQFGGGELYFTSASSAIFYPSAGATVSSGLTLIAKTNFTTGAASLAMTNVFSSTYDNYLVLVTRLVASGDAQEARVRVGTSGTAYAGADYDYEINAANNGAAYNAQSLNDSKFLMIGSYVGNVEPSSLTITINNPNLAVETTLTANNLGNRNTVLAAEQFAGALNTTTQYTDFFLGVQTPASDTHVAEIAVYGYAKS